METFDGVVNYGEMDDNQQEYLEGLIDFLSSWLINHILQMDKPIADF